MAQMVLQATRLRIYNMRVKREKTRSIIRSSRITNCEKKIVESPTKLNTQLFFVAWYILAFKKKLKTLLMIYVWEGMTRAKKTLVYADGSQKVHKQKMCLHIYISLPFYTYIVHSLLDIEYFIIFCLKLSKCLPQ